MECLNTHCDNDNDRDYPVCATCATTCHFEYRNDCRCAPCQVERAVVDISGLNDVPKFALVDANFHVINGIDPDYEAYLDARESMECPIAAAA